MKQSDSSSLLRRLLLTGILGCFLLAASDWIMIYGSTASHSSLSWLTEGVSRISAKRNAAALALSFPAVLCYLAALLGIRSLFIKRNVRELWYAAVCAGMLPWMAVHLFYIMILFLFAWLPANGFEAAAVPACEALFHQFRWFIPAAEVLMALPFLFFPVTVLLRKTSLPPFLAINSPILWLILLKALTFAMPDCAFRLAFTNGLMSEAMAVWFLLLIPAVSRYGVPEQI